MNLTGCAAISGIASSFTGHASSHFFSSVLAHVSTCLLGSHTGVRLKWQSQFFTVGNDSVI